MAGFTTKAELAEMMKRTLAKGSQFDDLVDDWIWLGENRLHNDLWPAKTEATVTIAGVGGEATLPPTFGIMLQLQTDDAEGVTLEPASRRMVMDTRRSNASTPRTFYVSGGKVQYDSTKSLDLLLTHLPGADHADGSELVTRYGNALYYAALLQSAPALGQDARLGTWAGFYNDELRLAKKSLFNQRAGSGRIRQRYAGP